MNLPRYKTYISIGYLSMSHISQAQSHVEIYISRLFLALEGFAQVIVVVAESTHSLALKAPG